MPLKTVLDSPELQQKVNGFSWQFLIGVLVAGAGAGYGYAKIHGQDEIQKMNYDFCIQEIQGLRNDQNREVFLLHKDIDELKQKLKE